MVQVSHTMDFCGCMGLYLLCIPLGGANTYTRTYLHTHHVTYNEVIDEHMCVHVHSDCMHVVSCLNIHIHIRGSYKEERPGISSPKKELSKAFSPLPKNFFQTKINLTGGYNHAVKL